MRDVGSQQTQQCAGQGWPHTFSTGSIGMYTRDWFICKSDMNSASDTNVASP
jgi:hypothetical protein